MAQGHNSDEKIVYVGDSRVRKSEKKHMPKDYSAYPGKSEAFVPNFLLKEWMVAVVVMVGILVLTMQELPPLGYPADPTNTTFIPMPDWYFLFLYQLLKFPYTSNEFVVFGTVVIPGLAFTALLLAPFLDTSKERRFYRRPIASGLMLTALASMIYLTYISWDHYQQELAAKGIVPEHIQREEEYRKAKEAGKEPETQQPQEPALPPIVEGDSPARALYEKSTCVQCHGADLKGMPNAKIPALLGVGDKYTKEEIMDIIKNGKGAMTPQYDMNINQGLSDADIEAIAEWLSKQKAPQQ